MELLGVLKVLDSHEAQTTDEGDCQIEQDSVLSAQLGLPDSHRHRQGRKQQHHRVGGPPPLVEELASPLKQVRVVCFIDCVKNKQASEKQHFGSQEKPHSQLSCFELLIETVEVVCQMRRVTMSMVMPFSVPTVVGFGSPFAVVLMRVAAHPISHLQAEPAVVRLE